MTQQSGGRGGFFANMFGNGPQEEGNQQQQQQQQQQGGEVPNENQLRFDTGHEEGNDPSAILSEFFAEDEGEEEGQNPGQQQQQQQQQQQNQQNLGPDGKPLPTDQEQRIMAGIQDIMKGLSPAEDLFDEDFNPNDPKAMRTMLGEVQKQTAQATLQMVLIPMREAMSTLTQELKADFASQLQNFGNQSSARSALERIVPEVRGEHSGMVNTLYAQAMKKKGATPEKAAGAVRQALDALGIKGAAGGNQSDPSSGASKRTGSSALDMYAPLK